jgi:hypothetical protein
MQRPRAPTETLWAHERFSQHSLVLVQLAQSPRLQMLVCPLQDGTSCLCLVALLPPIPNGCVLVEIQPSWAIGPSVLSSTRQACKIDVYSPTIFFVLGLDGQRTHLRTIRIRTRIGIIDITYYVTFAVKFSLINTLYLFRSPNPQLIISYTANKMERRYCCIIVETTRKLQSSGLRDLSASQVVSMSYYLVVVVSI